MALIHTGDHKLPFDIRDYSKHNIAGLYRYIQERKIECFHTTPNLLRKHIDVLKSLKPTSFSFPDLQFIECTGNYLTYESRQIIEDFFQAKTINMYGLIEVWGIGMTCPLGHMHVNEENVYLELINEDQQVITKPGIVGEVVVTSLNLKLMPIVRYATGDFAEYLESPCPCGNAGRRIQLRNQRKIHLLKNKTNTLNGEKAFQRVLRMTYWKQSFLDIEYITIEQTTIERFHVYVNPIENADQFQKLFTENTVNTLNREVDIVFHFLASKDIEKKNPKNYLFVNRISGNPEGASH